MGLDRYLGSFITAAPNPPTQSSAQGVWELEQQASAQVQNAWPLPPNVIQRSLRFNSADSAYLNRTPASASNRKTWTWSGWVKRSVVSTSYVIFNAGVTSTSFTGMQLTSNGAIEVFYYTTAFQFQVQTTAVFRDPSAWYHLVLSFDTTQATAANRVRLYINGTELTAFAVASYPTLNTDYSVNAAQAHLIGASAYNGTELANCYMAEVNFIDGQALTPSSFGETDAQTGVWVPKVYTGTYGTNGFRLPFTNNSTTTALGYDASGNGNNWTPNNFSVTAGTGNDSLLDVPSLYGTDTGLGGEVRGNYATWNPALPAFSGIITLSNGALDVTTSTGSTTGQSTYATFAVSSGKWYWEAMFSQSGSSSFEAHIGWATSATDNANAAYAYLRGGQKVTLGTTASYGSSFTTGDIIGVALDLDAGTMTFYKNGVSQGTAFTGLSGTLIPTVRVIREASYTSAWYGNFGQRPFAYTAPTGFKALCTTNLSAPAIGQTSTNQADNYFNTVLYTGTGSTQSVTGTGFQPDLVWIKSRSAATDHALYDAVRGVEKQLESNTTTDETTETTGLTAFGADGFTVGALAQVNTNTATYVAWQWYAGGSTVSNTQGTITSSVRANPSSGFSVITTNGSAGPATVGHGLNAVPGFIIGKDRDSAGTNWVIYHSSLGATKFLVFTTGAENIDSGVWGGTQPTSSLFTVGSYISGPFVWYAFAPITGFSAFGSYTGNGSADGPFVYLGFRPRWVLIKVATGSPAADWVLHDTSRNPYNVSDTKLSPNTSAADVTTSAVNIDILSSGFKIRNTDGAYNTSSNTYIYAAFAEYPFRLSLAR